MGSPRAFVRLAWRSFRPGIGRAIKEPEAPAAVEEQVAAE
jgi:hypothetical protein